MIVADTSVAVKWVFDEDHSVLALRLFRDCAARGEAVVAPRLLPFEVTNVIRQRVRRQGLGMTDAADAFEQFLRFGVTLLPGDDASRQPCITARWRSPTGYDLSATYDAHYVALAESLGCELWTADQRLLRRRLGPQMPSVRWIADYRAAV